MKPQTVLSLTREMISLLTKNEDSKGWVEHGGPGDGLFDRIMNRINTVETGYMQGVTVGDCIEQIDTAFRQKDYGTLVDFWKELMLITGGDVYKLRRWYFNFVFSANATGNCLFGTPPFITFPEEIRPGTEDDYKFDGSSLVTGLCVMKRKFDSMTRESNSEQTKQRSYKSLLKKLKANPLLQITFLKNTLIPELFSKIQNGTSPVIRFSIMTSIFTQLMDPEVHDEKPAPTEAVVEKDPYIYFTDINPPNKVPQSGTVADHVANVEYVLTHLKHAADKVIEIKAFIQNSAFQRELTEMFAHPVQMELLDSLDCRKRGTALSILIEQKVGIKGDHINPFYGLIIPSLDEKCQPGVEAEEVESLESFCAHHTRNLIEFGNTVFSTSEDLEKYSVWTEDNNPFSEGTLFWVHGSEKEDDDKNIMFINTSKRRPSHQIIYEALMTKLGYTAEMAKAGATQLDSQLRPNFESPLGSWESNAPTTNQWLQNHVMQSIYQHPKREKAMTDPKAQSNNIADNQALNNNIPDLLQRILTTLTSMKQPEHKAGANIIGVNASQINTGLPPLSGPSLQPGDVYSRLKEFLPNHYRSVTLPLNEYQGAPIDQLINTWLANTPLSIQPQMTTAPRHAMVGSLYAANPPKLTITKITDTQEIELSDGSKFVIGYDDSTNKLIITHVYASGNGGYMLVDGVYVKRDADYIVSSLIDGIESGHPFRSVALAVQRLTPPTLGYTPPTYTNY